MTPKKYFYAALASVACLSSLGAQQATLKTPSGTQMVVVGDPNNQADENGFGSVNTVFMMGAYEWTVQDWYNMLQDVAATVDPVTGKADAHGLWNVGMSRWITRTGSAASGYKYAIVPGMANLPITNVNIHDVHRACNYVQNKASLPLADGVSFDAITEHGAYDITINLDGRQMDVMSQSAQFYVPTIHQWHKSAYLGKDKNGQPYWWMYATQHDNNPGDRIGSIGNNKANYNLYPYGFYVAPSLALCDVNLCGGLDANGHPTGTYSYYGCFDMNGNVNEWTSDVNVLGNKVVRGGSYQDEYYIYNNNYLMRTVTPVSYSPETRSDTIGFRMAGVASADATSTGYAAAQSNTWSDMWSNLTTGEQELSIGAVVAAAALGGAYYMGYWTVDGVVAGARGALIRGGLMEDTTAKRAALQKAAAEAATEAEAAEAAADADAQILQSAEQQLRSAIARRTAVNAALQRVEENSENYLPLRESLNKADQAVTDAQKEVKAAKAASEAAAKAATDARAAAQAADQAVDEAAAPAINATSGSPERHVQMPEPISGDANGAAPARSWWNVPGKMYDWWYGTTTLQGEGL